MSLLPISPLLQLDDFQRSVYTTVRHSLDCFLGAGRLSIFFLLANKVLSHARSRILLYLLKNRITMRVDFLQDSWQFKVDREPQRDKIGRG